MATTGYIDVNPPLFIDVSGDSSNIKQLKDNDNNVIYFGLKSSLTNSCDNNYDLKKLA